MKTHLSHEADDLEADRSEKDVHVAEPVEFYHPCLFTTGEDEIVVPRWEDEGEKRCDCKRCQADKCSDARNVCIVSILFGIFPQIFSAHINALICRPRTPEDPSDDWGGGSRGEMFLARDSKTACYSGDAIYYQVWVLIFVIGSLVLIIYMLVTL